MNPENDNRENDVSLSEIAAFLKRRRGGILARALISAAVVILLVALLHAVLPRDSSYFRDVGILLPKSRPVVDDGRPLQRAYNRSEVCCYPNGRAFNAADIISPPVLKKVYDDNRLDGRLPFTKFRALFALTNSSREQEELDAEYRKKMTQRNISVVDLQTLEREYREKQQRISGDNLRITMTVPPGFSLTELTRIVNAIPEAWFQIYSKLEARQFPQIEVATGLKSGGAAPAPGTGGLILLEKTRLYQRRLLQVCEVLGEMLQGKNFYLPGGESLGDVRRQLESIERYQIGVLRQYILSTPSYRSAFDRVFVAGNLQRLEVALTEVNIKHAGVMESLNILQGGTTVPELKTPPDKGRGSGVALQLDDSFFNQFAAMVRNDVNNTLRAAYAEKAIEYGEQRAELEAEKIYFQQLQKQLDGAGEKAAAADAEQFNRLLRELCDDLAAVGGKVTQFRDKITAEYLLSRFFYTSIGTPQFQTEFRYPFHRMVFALIVLWGLYNLLGAVLSFYRQRETAAAANI